MAVARLGRIVVLCCGVLTITVGQVAAQGFTETFSAMPTDICFTDGAVVGEWRFVYDGYGCTAALGVDGNTVLMERPFAATDPLETHGSLVLGPAYTGDVSVAVSTTTVRQLRGGSAPNPWEVGWLLWNYTDDTHFYYAIAKPNGWELGKADPAYPGNQRFLATGSAPVFPVGPWYRLRVSQVGHTIQLFVDDVPVVAFTDAERPYTSGRVGLYTEDAEVYFDAVSVAGVRPTSKPAKGRKRP